MYRKLLAVLAVVSLGNIAVFAEDYHNGKETLKQNVKEAIAEYNMSFDRTAYGKYQKKVFEIKDPSYEALRPLFAELTVYNAEFANQQRKESWANIANTLAKDTWTGWNTYRPVGMVEIFDLYFPEENRDRDIAVFEYNIKRNVMPKEQQTVLAAFENMQEGFVTQFYATYNKFLHYVHFTDNYRPGEMLEQFTPVVYAYDELERNFPEGAFMVNRYVFAKPIFAGWGRTFTVRDLRSRLGYEESCGGDYVCAYSPEKLQEKYGVSEKTAQVFHRFVKDFNKNR